MARIWIGYRLKLDHVDLGERGTDKQEVLDESNALAAPSDVLLKGKICAFEQAADAEARAADPDHEIVYPAWQILRVDIGKPSVEKMCALLERSGYIEQPSALGVGGCGYDRVQILDVFLAPSADAGAGAVATLKKRRS